MLMQNMLVMGCQLCVGLEYGLLSHLCCLLRDCGNTNRYPDIRGCCRLSDAAGKTSGNGRRIRDDYADGDMPSGCHSDFGNVSDAVYKNTACISDRGDLHDSSGIFGAADIAGNCMSPIQMVLAHPTTEGI